MARSLGPDDFGRYALIFSIASLGALPVGTALNQFVMREAARARALNSLGVIKGLIVRAHAWILATGLLVLIALWLAGQTAENGLLKWGLPMIPLMALVALRTELIRGLGSTIASQWPDLILRPLAFVIVIFTLATADALTPETALLGYVVALLIALVALVVLYNSMMDNEEYRLSVTQFDDKRWLRSMPWFMAISGVGAVSTLSGVVILGSLNSDSGEVAAFQLGLSFAALIGLPLVVINLVAGPLVSGWWEVGDKASCEELLIKLTRAGAIFATAGGVLVIVFPKLILSTFYGDDYTFGFRSLQILAVSQVINVAFGPVGLVLTVCGFERIAFKGQLFGLLVSVGVSFVLVSQWGATGAAIGTLVGLLVWNLWMAANIRQEWGGPFLFLLGKRVNVE